MAPFRYRSPDEDSGRWTELPFRDGDIVISTRSKSGTTWMQMICALLVFQTPDLPAPLGELSPWFDWLVEPQDAVFARLAAQDHRRFLKTHTSLDGVLIDPRATYIVVARHPLDMAVSLYHQGANLDRERIARADRARRRRAEPSAPRPPLAEWLRAGSPGTPTPTSSWTRCPAWSGTLTDAWSRRHEPNIVLAHYADLSSDLEGEMRRLADRLGIAVPEDRWPELVRGGDVRRHAGPGAAPGPRPGRHHEGPRRVLPARDVGRRRGGPEPGGAGPLPRAGGRARRRPRSWPGSTTAAAPAAAQAARRGPEAAGVS